MKMSDEEKGCKIYTTKQGKKVKVCPKGNEVTVEEV